MAVDMFAVNGARYPFYRSGVAVGRKLSLFLAEQVLQLKITVVKGSC